MQYRKRIGIILGAIYKDMNREQLSGILEQAYALGNSAYVFTLGDGSVDPRSQHGEENLFCLLNFSLLDGIIYLPYTFTKDEYRSFLRDFLETYCPLPIVTISREEMQFPHVWNDDRAETAEIIRHLIRCHHCRHILYLTGPQGSPVSENRVLGYRDAMEEAGLPFDKSAVIYGDFWTEAARRLAREIASGKRPLPDAVACANDCMAISLCDALAKLGISVPENIRVTGYDGTVEAFIHDPQITTYRPPFRQLGRDAMCLLHKKITGKTPAAAFPPASGVLLARTACGCSPGVRDDSMTLFNYRRMEESYVDSDFTANLYAARTLREFIDKAFSFTYIFMEPDYWDRETYTLCLSEDWDRTQISGEELICRTKGFSDRMLLCTPGNTLHRFPADQMVPAEWNDTERCSVTFFNSMHFQDRCFGYSILRMEGIADGYSEHYVRFCREICNGLMFLCTQNQMRSLAYHHYLSQIRDELTGLYNAQGFGKLWKDVTGEAEVCDETVFLLCLNVSGLKQVQEMCGSVLCDKLLLDFAGILQGCCENRERCLRINTTDFVVMGTEKPPVRSSSVIAARLSERFEAYIRRREYPIRLRILEMIKVWESTPFPDAQEAGREMEMLLKAAAAKRPSYSEQMRYRELSALRNEIYQNPQENWNTAACAERLGLSMTHFQRIYQNTFGISCAHDIRKSKLTFAKQQLLRTKDTLQEIAAQCGYDYSHFMRIFRAETGMTPTEYRRGAGNSEKLP